MNLCIFDYHLIKKNNLYYMNKLGSRELYQLQIPAQLYYEEYFNNFDFDWKSIYLLPLISFYQLRVFQYKILSNILFVNKMIFKLRKVESPLCSFCKAEDETYIHLFYRCTKTSILWRQLQEFFSTALDLPNILPQTAILGFLNDALEHKLLLNHILLIFKNYMYKATENKNFNFNILKNYFTKLRDLESNLKDTDKYNKRWTVISNTL